MKYLDLINIFERWLESNFLSPSAQLLYYKILSIFNRAGWAEYVQVDNLRLMTLVCLRSEKSLLRARDELVAAGFIWVERGKKGSPNKYWLDKKHCKKDSISESVSDSTIASISESISASTIASHNKIKTKTKNNNKKNISTSNDVDIQKEAQEKTIKAAFAPPTLEEISDYVKSRNSNVDPKRFFEYYSTPDSSGRTWVDAKGNQVKNWKQKLITWESRDRTSPQGKREIVPDHLATRQVSDDDLARMRRLLGKIQGGGG